MTPADHARVFDAILHLERACNADVSEMIATLVGMTVTIAARTAKPLELLAIASAGLEEAMVAIAAMLKQPAPAAVEAAS